MEAAYPGKQVVFNLKIQPPRYQVATGLCGAKSAVVATSCSAHPVGIMPVCASGGGEAGALDGMRELKRQGQRQPEDQMYGHKHQEHVPPRMKKARQDERIAKIAQLRYDKDADVCHRRRR